ncbi:MAG: cysteine--tRNA ligase, partial [candidate division SR1 bacterium]
MPEQKSDSKPTLKLFNTLTREKEEFNPLNPDQVGMYSCGPTVYGTPSIGNVRASFTADLIRNTLELAGYTVKSVMNITDVGHLVGDGDEGEDKLEVGAKREGLTAREVARKYEKEFLEGLEKMHIAPFSIFPRATEHIQEQIDLVKTLEDKGYTYEIPNDGIYMNTSKIDDYGKLLGPNYKKHLENLRGGERVEMGG